jgi:YfiR/HmsC-like
MRRGLLCLTLAMLASSAVLASQAVTQPALKAAFLFRFSKFVEWPAEPTGPSPLTLCVLDDPAVEDALEQLLNDGSVNGRMVALVKGARNRPLRGCHLIYMGDSDPARVAATLDELKGVPILTVGDGDDFARAGGIIGLFVEDGRMRFAINPDAAQRAGLRLSSKLLSLAKIVKGRHGRT